MTESTIRINRVHYPVRVLGPGKRLGIWLQGCSNACKGCLAKDTWDAESGTVVKIAELVAEYRHLAANGVDGITISGGEPFEQPEALETLLRELHKWTDVLASPVDYLCYSGKSYSELQKHSEILRLLDTIIPEPLIVELPGKPLRGSDNQPVVTLTELGAKRYEVHTDESRQQLNKCIQFVMEGDGSVSFIGIPERGDMQKLVEICKTHGVFLKDVSWE